jgi:hypothetical protein
MLGNVFVLHSYKVTYFVQLMRDIHTDSAYLLCTHNSDLIIILFLLKTPWF